MQDLAGEFQEAPDFVFRHNRQDHQGLATAVNKPVRIQISPKTVSKMSITPDVC